MRDPLALRVAATPQRPALVRAGDEPDATIRYESLDETVAETAGQLAALDIGAGDHVATLVDPGPWAVRLVHAALRLGVTLVPLSTRLVTAELRERIDRADVSHVLAAPETAGAASDAAGDIPVTSVESLPTPLPSLQADAQSDPALILFTSGTTGRPKAVPLSLSNLLASAAASATRLGVLPDDRWYDPLPTYHMGGLAPIIRSALYGTTLVLETGDGFDASWTLDRLADHRPSGISLVPTMLERLLDAGQLPDSLRFVLLGGAPARDQLIRTCERRAIPVCPTYGMTETASQIATARPAEAFAHPGTVGTPLLGMDVTILTEAGAPAPAGEPGEIVVDGPSVTASYYGDETTRADSFDAAGLHTGDIGYRDEAGRLWILNRQSDRIVTGGENVDPGEVVDVLTAHPEIDDAAVVGLADPEWGERVAALVVGTADPATIRPHCRDRLAGFKHPRRVAVARSLPRTDSGTIDRAAVRERLRDDGEPL